MYNRKSWIFWTLNSFFRILYSHSRCIKAHSLIDYRLGTHSKPLIVQVETVLIKDPCHVAGNPKNEWSLTLSHQMYKLSGAYSWREYFSQLTNKKGPFWLVGKTCENMKFQLESLNVYELQHSIIKCTADDLESFGTYSWPEYLPHCWPNNGLADAADSSWIYGRLPKSLCLFPFSDWRSDGIAKLFKNCKLFLQQDRLRTKGQTKASFLTGMLNLKGHNAKERKRNNQDKKILLDHSSHTIDASYCSQVLKQFEEHFF